MCMSQLLQNTPHTHTHTHPPHPRHTHPTHPHTHPHTHPTPPPPHINIYIMSHTVGLVTHRLHYHDHGQNHKTLQYRELESSGLGEAHRSYAVLVGWAWAWKLSMEKFNFVSFDYYVVGPSLVWLCFFETNYCLQMIYAYAWFVECMIFEFARPLV